MPNIGEFAFGTKGKVKKAKTLSQGQLDMKSLIDLALKTGEGPFADLFGEFNAEEFNQGVSQPLVKQFQEEILPQLNEKFISGNQVLGSGMRRAQNKAAVDLQSNLAKLMYEAKQGQKQNRLKGIETSIGTKEFENIYKPGTKGAAQGFIEGIGEGIGSGVGGKIAG